MKRIYIKTGVSSSFLKYSLLIIAIFYCSIIFVSAQVQKPFTQRTSSYTPTKKIYNIKGDFTMIGNTNLTLVSYGDGTNNSNNDMKLVDLDGDASTNNSSAATLTFSTENGAIPACSHIIYAGLYWTGRTNSSVSTATKRNIKLKGPGQISYQSYNATVSDIQYPGDNDMYAGYIEVTDQVRQYGLGQYWVADMALTTGNGGSTGYYGGWGIIVVYENSKMKWRDVTIFDGYAYVSGNVSAYYDLPVSGFNTVQSGPVNMKLGMMAGEGDIGISGDYFQIQKVSDASWLSLNHAGNTASNFFNSSVFTGGNARNPNLTNNTGVDISMFTIPNTNNSVVTNNQTSTTFRYGSTQDTYIIFCIAMAVDAYVPQADGLNLLQNIGGVPYSPGNPLVTLPEDELEFKVDIRNKGTEAINNFKVVLPIPYASSYVSCSKVVNFTPLPSPNSLYFDPTLGSTGSIVWDFGTLILPVDPNTILGTLTYKIKVTENCAILTNTTCSPTISVNGIISGTGAISGVNLNSSFIQGYVTNGSCTGEPLTGNINLGINATNYIALNCQETPVIRQFFFCNAGTSIPITSVSGDFPPGCRFYNSFPIIPSTIEYTISNPFPATSGAVTYYAVPPGSTDCYFEFIINVSNINTVPTTQPVTYCIGSVAQPLTAIPSNSSYFLYYYTTNSPSETPQISITPSTSAIGTTTYYVAEGASASCISPNRVPIVVTVTALPVVGVSSNSPICIGSNIYLYETGGAAASWSWTGPNGFTSNDQNPVILGASAAYNGNYTVTVGNGGSCSKSATTTVLINNDPIVVTDCPNNITECADTIYNGVLGSFVDWQLPNFNLNCLSGGGTHSFIMKFELPEVKWACWQFNRVQRVGTNSGVVNLWQSSGSGDPSILTPSVYIEPALDVEMDIICPSGQDFTWKIYLVNGAIQTLAGSVFVNATGHYTINVPATFAKGVYKLKFEFSGNGSNKCAVDNIYFDALLMDLGSCISGIEFNVTGPLPGFFPVGTANQLYTATYTPVSGSPSILTCSFDVTVEGVTAQVTSINNSSCSLNNGSISITAQSSATSHNFEYSINGNPWVPFGIGNTQVTISNIPSGNYFIDVRELGHVGDCHILHRLDVTVGKIIDNTPPLITCPSNYSIEGCNTSVITGLDYSESLIEITSAQFIAAGGIASDNCGIVHYYYQDTKNGICPIIVSRVFTVSDLAGSSVSCTQTITIYHTTTPTQIGGPVSTSSTVECASAAVAPVLPVVKDVCGTTITAPTPVITGTYTNCEGTKIYTYTYVDCSGLQYVWTYTYTIDHTIAPTQIGTPVAIASTVECASAAVVPALPVVKDVCGNTITAPTPVITGTYTNCEGTKIYTYTYVDCSGLQYVWTYTYTIDHTIAPTQIGTPVAIASTVECTSAAVAPVLPVVKDVCGNTISAPTPVITGTYTNCEGTKIYTYTYVDCSGLQYVWTYTYTIDHTIAPTQIGTPVAIASTVECASAAVVPTLPVVKDVCGNTLSVPEPVITGTYSNCEGTKIYTYTYADCSGLQYVWTYTYTIDHTIAPTQIGTPVAIASTVECASAAVAPVLPVVKDVCGNTISAPTPVITGTYTNCEGTKIYTYTYVDCSGLQYVWTYTYTIDHTIAPTQIGTPVAIASTVECASAAIAPVLPVVKDVCGTTITAPTPVITGTYTNCEGTKIYTYTYVDCSGLQYVWTYTYTIDHTIAPTQIGTPVAIASTVECTSAAVAPVLPVVKDVCGTTITAPTPVITGTYTNCEGTKIYTYTYVDCSGLQYVWTYTYTIDHTIAPTQIGTPVAIASTVECASAAIAPVLPVVKDVCGTTITAPTPVITGTYTNCEGTKIYTYTYVDCSGLQYVWTYTYTIDHTIAPTQIGTPVAIASTVECASAAVAPVLPVVKDVCGTTITATTPVITGTYTNCEGTKIYTYTYVDCSGLQYVWTYTYTIDHTIAPTQIGTPVAIASTVECASAAVVPALPVVKDVCGTTITAPTPVITGTYTNCEGTKIYTYTYVDCSGLQYVWTYTYTIDHTIAPTQIGTPVAIASTVECASAAVVPALPVVKDVCGNTITAPTPVITGTYTNCEGTKIYTYTYVDCSGLQYVWTYTYTIDHTIAPTQIGTPVAIASTVECASAAVAPVLPVVKDVCGNTISAPTPVITGTYTNCEGTKIYTYTYVDCSGLQYVWTYTYTIDHTIAPTQIGTPVAIASTVECASAAVVPTLPVVKDVCGNTLSVPEPVITGTYSNCEGTKIYTYTYADCSGLQYVWTYTYTIDHTIAPTQIGTPVAIASTVECASAAVAPVLPVVKDVCGNTISAPTPVITGTYTNCEGTKIYTYTYVDCSGLQYVWTYTYTIDHTIAPTQIGTPVAIASTVECASAAIAPVLPVVKDVCGTTITAPTPVITGTYTNCEGTKIYTYTYVDCSGLQYVWTYTYTIDHTIAPTQIGTPVAIASTVECASAAVAPVLPVVKDVCGTTITAPTPVITGTYTNCEGTKIYTYTYVDCSGLQYVWTYTYTITHIDFTMPANGDSTIACVTLAVQPTPPVITDNCGNILTPSAPIIGGTYEDCEGTKTYTFVFTDCAGHTHNWIYTYTIERLPFVDPQDAGSTVACAALAVTPALPLVKDNCGNVLIPNGPTMGGTFTTCEGTKTYTYLYTDCEGNTNDWVYTYTIEQQPFIDPIDAGSTVACVALAVPPVLPIVSGNCGNTITPSGPTIGGNYAGCEGTITYTYLFTDCEGNTNDWVYTYTIERLPFVDPQDAGSTVSCAALAVTPALPLVTDNCGYVLIPTGPTMGGTYTTCEGTKTYTYLYTDCEGNSNNWIYTYTISRLDFIMPANGGSTVACAAFVVPPTPPVITDNCGNILTPSAPTIGGTYEGCQGTKTYTFVYTDCAGHSHNWVYTYTITRLDFTMPANGGSTVACAALAVVPTAPVITDNCGNLLTPSTPTIGGTYQGCEGTITYTFVYTDCAGHAHNWVYTYTITRLDITMPANSVSTVGCAALAVQPTPPLITDNCGNVLTPSTPTIGGTYANCEGTKTYTFVYTDCAGHSHNWVYTYTITRLDFTMLANGGSTIACPAMAIQPTPPVITDNCGNTLTPSTPTIGGTYQACEGTKTYTFVYTDCAGHAHNWVYTYTITRLDFTMPANGGSVVACATLAVVPTPPTITDNCGNILTPSTPTIGGTYTNCEGTKTYTFVYTDCAGHSHNWVYTYTITLLDFTMPANGGSTIACSTLAVQPTPPTITDNCGNTLTPSTPTIGGTYTNCEGTKTYTFVYTDCAGHSHNWVYTYTITRLDFTMPANGGSTIACATLAVVPTAPVITDNCGNLLTPSTPTIGGTYTGCEGTKTYTFVYTDCAGHTHNWVYTYTITHLDFTMPANGESTIACAALAVQPTPPVITDNCGNTLTPSNPTLGGTYESCEGTKTYTFVYTDCAGHSHNWIYTYTIERLPFANPIDSGSIIACAALAVQPTPPVITDNCGNILTPSTPFIEGTYNGCEGTITYTYLYSDCEENTQDWVYTYTITRLDFTMPANGGSTVACVALAVQPTPPAITDNCGNTLTPSTPTIGGTIEGCEGTKTYTFVYTDCAGHAHNWVYTYTITRLDFTMPANGGSTVTCAALAVLPTAPVITDNCGNTLTPSTPTIGGTYQGCEGTKTYTFVYTDCAGHSHNWVYTYTITSLDFTMPANAGSTVACAALAVIPTPPVITDNCGNTLTPTIPTVSGGTYFDCEGTRTYTFVYTDCAGHAHDWVYTYTITRLDFTMPANGESTIACAALAVQPTPPVITDNCGNTLTPSNPTLGGTYEGCEGTKTYTFVYTDCAGHSHNWVYTYTITSLDFTIPTSGASTVACAALAVLPTAPVITDNCGNVLTPSTPIIGGTYEGCQGTKTYTFVYTDCAGHSHNWVYTYTITSLDFTIPTSGASTVACAALAVLPTAPVITDNCGNVLTPSTPVIGGTFTSCEGTKTYTFVYTDCAGHTHNWVYTYTIEVNDFTMPNNAGSTVACVSQITLPTPPMVYDNCGNSINPSGPVVSANPVCQGTKTFTWTYIDCEGNSHNWIYTYTVNDNLPPTFTRPSDITIYALANCTYNDSVAYTGDVINEEDNCSTGLQATYTDVVANGPCQGSKIITRTWHLADNCGNAAADQVQTITVSDTTAPVVTCPASITVNNDPTLCGANVTVAQPTFVENCSSVTIINSFNQTSDASGFYPVGITTVLWTLTDACGNSSYCSMTVTVIDNEPPVITCPADVISCSSEFNLGRPVVSDNCGIESITNNAPETFPIGVTIVTWTVTDIHGNIATCDQSVSLSNISATVEGTATLDCYGYTNGTIIVTATGGITPYSYSLNGNPSQSSNEFTDLPAGSYNIIVSDESNQCQFNVDFTIGNPDSISVDLAKYADANCAGKRDGEIELEVSGGTGSYQYNWSNGETTQHLNSLDAGEYTVTITDVKGCEYIYTKSVMAGSHEEPLVVNNAFSPNGDGINDYWVIRNIELYPDNEVIVLNRWGNEIYTMKNYDNTWDGSKLSEGTYFYILKVNLCGEPATLNGYITIIR